ncbi:fibronectin type III domain-containing protein [uncultured Robinsoniella sp.]|uniref:fibronectin type III domain-containing protein n=1 Tax=Robinsoniella sp. TaxID=2496533 RepID=UPI00374F9B84
MKKKILSMLTALAVIVSSIAPGITVSAAADQEAGTGTTYYVSTLNGKDSNDGTSESKPFYSLQKINELSLQPGDRVLLESGSEFTNGYLHLFGQSGSPEDPIVIDKYGEGNDPVINTNGQGIWYQNYGQPLDSASHVYTGYVSSSILLYDSEYIEINNLEMSNRGPKIETVYNSQKVMERTGVAAVAQDKGTVDHIYLNNLNIHDVIGNVYDKHMNNGGIYFTVFKPNDESKTGISRYEDVKIENCMVENVNRWGIAVGYTAYHAQFNNTAIPDSVIAKYGSGNVVIRNNYVKEPGGDAITTMYCDRPLIEYNVSEGAARQINETDYSATSSGRVAAAIWPWKCKDAVFQYNEAFDTYFNQDGQAWDADSGDGTLYQYNYSHNNGGGCIMFCLGQAYQNTFRYNISQNDLAGVINAPSQPDAHIYNNVFYVKDGVPFIRPGMTGGVMNLENNIIYYAGEQARTENWTLNGTRASYSNNLYYNYANLPADDENAVNVAAGTPVFADPGKAPSTTNGTANPHHDPTQETVFDGYKLAENSPAINAGKFITDNGGKDFYGNEVTGTPDIGAYESASVSLDLYSSVYTIAEYKISGLAKNTTVDQFLGNLSYDKKLEVQVFDREEQELTGDDIVTGGSKLALSNGSQTVEYTVTANTDNSIHDSVFELKDQTIYVPMTEKATVSVVDIINGITVNDTAAIKIYQNDAEVTQGSAADGMILKVIAEDGSEAEYTLAAKNEYQWAKDFVEAKQGNVWFAQQKENNEYSNMTVFDNTYATWNGKDYAVIGLEGNRGQQTADKRGLFCDALAVSQRGQGYSAAYRSPVNGNIILSFKDMGDKKNAFLRMATTADPNTGSDVFLTITKNGVQIGEQIQIPNDGTGVEIAPAEIPVAKGDYIRLEIKNIGAQNASKSSAYVTPVITYTDPAEADTQAPTTPENIKAEEVTDTSASISWNASTDNVGVKGYEVKNGDELLKDITEGTSTILDGLTPSTDYTLTVTAYDAAGNKSQPGSVTFRTKDMEDTQKPSAPAEVRADDITDTTAMISWTASTDNKGVAGYRIKNGEVILKDQVTDTQAQLTNLNSGTAYVINVVAYDAAGNESDPGTVSFTTLGEPENPDTEKPSIPADVKAENITAAAADISWTAATDNIGVAGYKVMKQDTLLANVTEGTSYSLTGLTPQTAYTIDIIAYDVAGNESDPGSVTFTTLELKDDEAPSAPENVKADPVGQTTAWISWNPSNDNVGVAGYEVKNGGTILADVTEGTGVEIKDLLRGTQYTISVEAYDAAGNRSEPGMVDFTTLRADASGLNAKISEAQAIKNDGGIYTKSSYRDLQAAISEAKEIAGNKNSSDEEIRAAITRLENAMKLVKVTLTLNMAKAEMEAGDMLQLTSSTNEVETAVTWSSSNGKVVTVDAKGMVKAAAAGTAVVKANLGTISAECTITVKSRPAPEPGPTLTLNKSSATIYTKGTTSVRLTAKVTGPSKKVSWKSGDTKIATVKNGKVTAKKAGKVTITATANGIRRTCRITVKKPALKLTKTKLTLYTKGRTTAEIGAKITGSSKRIVWKTSNKKIATVKGGKITAKKAGKVTITAKANGITKRCEVNVKKPSLSVKGSTAVNLKKGKSAKISVKVKPAGKIRFQSSKSKIVSVSSKGEMKALKKGKAEITVSCYGIKKIITVHVN